MHYWGDLPQSVNQRLGEVSLANIHWQKSAGPPASTSPGNVTVEIVRSVIYFRLFQPDDDETRRAELPPVLGRL